MLHNSMDRRLGAFEELFWLYDQASPVHFAMVAEVDGHSEVAEWRTALNAVQSRHPSLNVFIDAASRSFHPATDAPIPLRVRASADLSWAEELRKELATPFLPQQAPLLRAVLLHHADACTFFLIAHHSIADGLSLVYVMRDVLAALSGAELSMLGPTSAQESVFGHLALGRATPVAEQMRPVSAEPAPDLEYRRLSPALTEAVAIASRRQNTSVQGLLCAAIAIAGAELAAEWRGKPIRLVSPISTRTWTDAQEQCCFSIVPATLSLSPEKGDVWAMARRAREDLRAFQAEDAIAGTMAAVHGLASTSLQVATAQDFMESAFPSEGMVSNLGVLPIGTDFRTLELRALWGPAVLTIGKSAQVFGALTTAGSLHLTHVSHQLVSGMLERTEQLLAKACNR